jgi:hypothetical protein
MDSDGSVALQAWTGKYLRARPNGDAKADCNHVGDWESKRWCLNNMSMFLALPSWHGKYLICDNLLDPGQFERADRNGIHEWAIVNNDNALVEPAHSLKCVIGASSISTGVPAGAPVSLAEIAVRLLMDSVLKASGRYGLVGRRCILWQSHYSCLFRSSVDWSNLGVGSRCRWWCHGNPKSERGTHVLP